MKLAEECEEAGFKTVRSTGEQEPRDIDLKALEARADAVHLARTESGSADLSARELGERSARALLVLVAKEGLAIPSKWGGKL